MKMINKETVRIGAIKSELEAARIYDFLAILTEGLNVSKIIVQIYNIIGQNKLQLQHQAAENNSLRILL